MTKNDPKRGIWKVIQESFMKIVFPQAENNDRRKKSNNKNSGSRYMQNWEAFLGRETPHTYETLPHTI